MAAPSVPHEELEHLKPGQLLRAFAFGVFTELPSLLDGVVPRFEISRACLDAVDRTLRIFDPTQTPENIRPVVKRKGDKLFASSLPMASVRVLSRMRCGPPRSR
jgi:hypothetical protein